jgi:hypothetical protein
MRILVKKIPQPKKLRRDNASVDKILANICVICVHLLTSAIKKIIFDDWFND